MIYIPKAPIFISALILITLVIYSSATDFKDCGSAKGKVANVTVTGCANGVHPCRLIRGKDTTLTISFEMGEDVTDLAAQAFGVIAGLKVPFNPPHPDACVDSGLTCPLSNGKVYKYNSVIAVKSYYPSVKVIVLWYLKDEKAQNVVCVGIDAQIVSE